MAIQAPDLNQNALSKLQAKEQFPVVQEKKVEKINIAKGTIQEQVKLALEMMKDWETPVIKVSNINISNVDISKLSHYASNKSKYNLFNATLEFANAFSDNIKKFTWQDINKLNDYWKVEFYNIVQEFQENNPWVMLWKSNPYWKAIFEAVKVKNSEKKDFSLEKKILKELKLAIISSWVKHQITDLDKYYSHVYAREFLSQFKNIWNSKELEDILYNWQIEWTDKYWDNSISDFYELVWYIKKWEKVIESYIYDTIKEDLPNFYKQISQKEYSIFSKKFYIIIDKEEKVAEEKKKVTEKKKKVAEEKKKVAEKKKKVAEKEKRVKKARELLKRIWW